MYLRMVDATLRTNSEELINEAYGEILNSLKDTPGCIFAGLLHNEDESKSYISLTLWKSEKDTEAYMRSGEYQKNLDLVKNLLEEGSEWKIQLSEDNIVELAQIAVEPKINIYPVADTQESLPSDIPAGSTIMRVLSLKINKGYKEEFKNIYNNEILPTFKKIDGCSYALLLDNTESEGEMISLSIWDNPESIDLYEKKGIYRDLLEKISHTLGGLYQWKMALENRSRSKTAVTSQDIGISKFRLLRGRKFI